MAPLSMAMAAYSSEPSAPAPCEVISLVNEGQSFNSFMTRMLNCGTKQLVGERPVNSAPTCSRPIPASFIAAIPASTCICSALLRTPSDLREIKMDEPMMAVLQDLMDISRGWGNSTTPPGVSMSLAAAVNRRFRAERPKNNRNRGAVTGCGHQAGLVRAEE